MHFSKAVDIVSGEIILLNTSSRYNYPKRREATHKGNGILARNGWHGGLGRQHFLWSPLGSASFITYSNDWKGDCRRIAHNSWAMLSGRQRVHIYIPQHDIRN